MFTFTVGCRRELEAWDEAKLDDENDTFAFYVWKGFDNLLNNHIDIVFFSVLIILLHDFVYQNCLEIRMKRESMLTKFQRGALLADTTNDELCTVQIATKPAETVKTKVVRKYSRSCISK